MVFENIWIKPPDFVNKIGVKWWLDKETTKYSKSKGLDDVVVWYVEDTEQVRTRLIVQNNEPVEDCQSLEGILSKIDVLYLLKHMDNL